MIPFSPTLLYNYNRMYERTPEFREKMSQARLGKHMHSPEARQQMSQTRLGRRHSSEAREKMRLAGLGRHHSEEAKAKVRVARARQIMWPVSLATREKIRQARLRQVYPTKMTSIEKTLCNQFKKRRLKFEMHKTMFGRFQPDFMFESVKLIVQADGDYWHRQRRDRKDGDRRFNGRACAEGWTVWRFAESEIVQHPEACGRAVARFVRSH